MRGLGYDQKSNIAEIEAEQKPFTDANLKIQLDTILAHGLAADKNDPNVPTDKRNGKTTS